MAIKQFIEIYLILNKLLSPKTEKLSNKMIVEEIEPILIQQPDGSSKIGKQKSTISNINEYLN